MEIKERKLILRVRLEGRSFHVFEDALIDTGAAFTVLPPETADLLELQVKKDFPRARLVTASGMIETPVKVLEMLEVAGIRIKRLPVVVHKIPDPAPMKVLLGMNFMERVRLVVDGKRGRFELKDPT